MRIALFHNLPSGGAKRAAYEHGRLLAARGHVVDGYVLSSADERYLPLTDFCREVFRFDSAEFRVTHVWRMILGRRARVLWRVMGSTAYNVVADRVEAHTQRRQLAALDGQYEQVAAEIDSRGYDLVYVHHCRHLLAPRLLGLLETPTVYYCQDTLRHVHEWAFEEAPDYDEAVERRWRRKQKGRLVGGATLALWQELDRRNNANARSAGVVLANSRYSQEAIWRAQGVRAKLCYLGVDGRLFRPDEASPRRNEVLSVGSLTPAKGHDFVIRAAGTIPERRRPAVRIVGNDVSPGRTAAGSATQRLRSLAEQYGVSLEVSPDVSDQALREAYRHAGVVACAAMLEPFGLVVLEAMACGAPVVAVAEGGFRETVQHGVTGLLTSREEIEFGETLDAVLAEPELAAAMGRAGRAAVEAHWSWDRSVSSLEAIFRGAARQVAAPEPEVELDRHALAAVG